MHVKSLSLMRFACMSVYKEKCIGSLEAQNGSSNVMCAVKQM